MKINDILNEHGLVPMYSTMKAYGMRKKTTNGQKHFVTDDTNESIQEAQFDEAAGEKDACYHKVKSRYKVWPSAYASGALVKCRKVGASNWGNSKK